MDPFQSQNPQTRYALFLNGTDDASDAKVVGADEVHVRDGFVRFSDRAGNTRLLVPDKRVGLVIRLKDLPEKKQEEAKRGG